MRYNVLYRLALQERDENEIEKQVIENYSQLMNSFFQHKIWNFTNRCNLKCLHCRQSSTALCLDKELTTNEAFAIVDKLAYAGVSILTFSCGELLLRSDSFYIIKRTSENGLYCTIASNGIPFL